MGPPPPAELHPCSTTAGSPRDDLWLLAEEGLEIGGDPFRSFPIRAMPCLRINKKPSAWNRGHETVLVCAGEERVVLAPYKQRRRCNPGKLFDVVVCEQAIECAAPQASRQLQTFSHDPLEERFRKGQIGRARLKLARESSGHRIREIVQGSPCIQHGGSTGRNAGANQHQASDLPGVGNRDASRNEAPEGVPDESGPLDRNGVQERNRISGEVVDAVSAIGLFEVAADFSIAETCVFPWCKKFMVMARLRDILAGRQF